MQRLFTVYLTRFLPDRLRDDQPERLVPTLFTKELTFKRRRASPDDFYLLTGG